MVATKDVDWDALAFTCKKEVNPPHDPEADGWYRQARKLQKQDEDKHIRLIMELMSKAIERDHYNAMHRLALIYMNGAEGVAPDTEKSVELVERVIKLNVASGFYQMGVMLEQGIGVRQDPKAALTYMRKAADMGNPQAQYAVARKLMRMEGAEVRQRVVPIGLAMLECSFAQDHAEAGYYLGVHYINSSTHGLDKALKAFQKAGSLGSSEALFWLHDAFKMGVDGVEKDSQRAACYDRLWRDADADKSQKFPDLDRICPLPPAPMPES